MKSAMSVTKSTERSFREISIKDKIDNLRKSIDNCFPRSREQSIEGSTVDLKSTQYLKSFTNLTSPPSYDSRIKQGILKSKKKSSAKKPSAF